MRITFLLPCLDMSGGNRVTAIYAERLRRRGHEVTVVARPPRKITLRRRLKALVRWHAWLRYVHRMPSHLDATPVRVLLPESFRPMTDADLPDADVVIATWWETAEWAAKLSPRKGAGCYFVQGYECHEGQPVERVKATYHLPLHLITISQWLADVLHIENGAPDVTLVPNSVDCDQFFAPPRGRHDPFTVGFIYSRQPLKGCDVTLKAITLARERLPQLRVTAFGMHPIGTELPLPKGAHYVLHPKQDQLRELYAQCDVWLLASRREGFGLPILEAMACRTPVISTPVGAAPQILAGGRGVLVNINDSQAMAEAILRVHAMPPDQWKILSDNAFAYARQYSWDDATALFEKALESAVHNAGRAPK